MTVSQPTRVLVVYATISGATHGVATRIAETLRQAGLSTDLRSTDLAKDPTPYDAFVVGSPVYNGQWVSGAESWIREHHAVLASGRAWLFSVGSFSDDKPIIGRLIRREPRDINDIRRIVRAQDYKVFAGVVSAESWPRLGRILLHALGSHEGDNRDWPKIECWAMAIASALAPDPSL